MIDFRHGPREVPELGETQMDGRKDRAYMASWSRRQGNPWSALYFPSWPADPQPWIRRGDPSED